MEGFHKARTYLERMRLVLPGTPVVQSVTLEIAPLRLVMDTFCPGAYETLTLVAIVNSLFVDDA